jgi:NAD(P)-dependent dehydrogenase (short-subunit alcohol dehydrogenase family)
VSAAGIAGEAIWISGASSGIGAALLDSVPAEAAHVIGISRRPSEAPDHLAVDLADPAGWDPVRASFDQLLQPGLPRATFLHFSGIGSPHGPAADADPQEYERGVLLNGASGQVLGQHFLRGCKAAGIPCRIVLCSSPAALQPLYGMSHYNAAKASLDRWAECIRLEVTPAEAIVFTVVPWSVDTPMLRGVMDLPPEVDPLGQELKAMGERGELASAEGVAEEIWALLDRGGVEEAAFVGAIPADLGGAGS